MVKTEGGIFGAVSSTAKVMAALGVGKGEDQAAFVDFSGVDGNSFTASPKRTVIVTPDI